MIRLYYRQMKEFVADKAITTQYIQEMVDVALRNFIRVW